MVKDIIFTLTEKFALLGREKDIIKVILSYFPKCYKKTVDQNGNLILSIEPKSYKKHILLDAHLDQIGLVVTNVFDDGFLKVAPCGGVDARVLPGSLVKIYSDSNKTFDGVITSTPPHLSKNDKSDEFSKVSDLFVDTGLNLKKEGSNLIKPGDFIGFTCKPQKLLNNNITAPGLDNNAGVAVLICCAKTLSENKENLKTKVSFLFSTGEEITGVGAKTATFSISPDEAISVDTSFADQKNVPEDKCGKLSFGPMIGISPILSKKLSQSLINIAKKQKISYQLEIMSGKTSTNADDITLSKTGVKTALVSIPLRYMHTPVEVINLDDVKNTAKLLSSYILKGGQDND